MAEARGLEIEQSAGINPFRFGFVGAADFHSGISASEEENFAALGTTPQARPRATGTGVPWRLTMPQACDTAR
ncbi:MAG: DUF3604 domain-containing protein [Gammaproteobacteria bacterium]|nr:DUF3604 domain-containing protein [Gammaproteobacteria bacterium]